MIWLTYNQHFLQDGVGAQAQRILSLYLIARSNGWKYIHVPIITQRNGLPVSTLNNFNQLIALPSDPLPSDMKNITMNTIDVPLIKQLQNNRTDYLVVVTFAHDYLDHHPELFTGSLRDNLCFPNWIATPTDSHIPRIIVIHLRRGDVSLTTNRNRYVKLSYYLDTLVYLHELLTSHQIPYQFHLHSESESSSPSSPSSPFQREVALLSAKFSLNVHLDEPVDQVFKAFVNADLLFTGFSSLSYSAALLHEKGLVLHPPYWHRYPSSAICIKHPRDIISYQTQILCGIQGKPPNSL